MRLSLLALALAAGCASTPPRMLALPQSQVRDGVRIEVTKLAGPWTRPLALSGTLENVSPTTIALYRLRLDGLGYQGRVVGRAATEVENLSPGEKRSFRAPFGSPTPTGLHQVMIGLAQAKR